MSQISQVRDCFLALKWPGNKNSTKKNFLKKNLYLLNLPKENVSTQFKINLPSECVGKYTNKINVSFKSKKLNHHFSLCLLSLYLSLLKSVIVVYNQLFLSVIYLHRKQKRNLYLQLKSTFFFYIINTIILFEIFSFPQKPMFVRNGFQNFLTKFPILMLYNNPHNLIAENSL